MKYVYLPVLFTVGKLYLKEASVILGTSRRGSMSF